MNICPGCEAEIDEGMELCPTCSGKDKEEIEAVVEGVDQDDASLTLEDGQSFSLQQDETVLGRSDPMEGIDPDVDLSVHGGFESGVSRRHALIYRDGRNWSLKDLGSTNGTVVNRQKVSPGDPVNLTEGDVIHLGNLKAVFHVGTGTGGAS
jgi:pSer/pThr/pTyr-binding forkhead associated (FHA) protein